MQRLRSGFSEFSSDPELLGKTTTKYCQRRCKCIRGRQENIFLFLFFLNKPWTTFFVCGSFEMQSWKRQSPLSLPLCRVFWRIHWRENISSRLEIALIILRFQNPKLSFKKWIFINLQQEVFPVEYGPQYDTALHVLLWELLSKLEKMLPVPDLKQVFILVQSDSFT